MDKTFNKYSKAISFRKRKKYRNISKYARNR